MPKKIKFADLKHISAKRELYFFKCLKCGHDKRQSLLKERAKKGLCGVCRRNLVHPDQVEIPMEGLKYGKN